MVTALRRLREEHAGISKVLDVMERELDRLGAGKRPRVEVLEPALRYCTDFPAACHHPKEDLVYERLRARHEVTDQAIDDLVAEHRRLADKGAAFLTAVQALETDGDGALVELIAAGRDYVAFYRRHIDQEEMVFFPTALESLSEEDWAEIDARAGNPADPLFGPAAEARFAALRNAVLAPEESGAQAHQRPRSDTSRSKA